MTEMLDRWALTAPEIFLGVSFVLMVGMFVAWKLKSPASRQWAAEISVLAAICTLVICLIPLPRWNLRTSLFEVGFQSFELAHLSEPHSPPTTSESRTPNAFEGQRHDDSLAPQIQESAGLDTHGLAADERPINASIVTSQDHEVSHAIRIDDSTSDVHIASAGDVANTSNTSNMAHAPFRLVTIFYLIGSGVCIVWLLYGRIALANILQRSAPSPPAIQDIYAKIDRRRISQVRVSNANIGPISFGLFRPKIILPATLATGGSASTLRHVLLHEQEHVDRCDGVGHAIVNLALPLFYVHPFYWLLRRTIEFNRELIADDRAAASSTKELYIEDLLMLLRNSQFRLGNTIGAIGIVRRASPIAVRMEQLMHRDHPLVPHVGRLWKMAIVSLCFGVAGGASLFIGARRVVGDETPQKNIEVSPASVAAKLDASNVEDPNNVVPNKSVLTEADFDASTSDNNSVSAPAVKSTDTDGFTIRRNNFFVTGARVDIVSALDGFLAKQTIKEGQHVKKGDLIAETGSHQALANYEKLRAEFGLLRDSGKLDLQIKHAELELDDANVKLRLTKRASDKRAGTVAESLMRNLESSVRLAENSLAMAKLERKRAEMRASVKKLDLDLAARALKDRRIVAPIDGVVSKIAVRNGQWVSAGTPICSVVEMKRLRVVGAISSNEFNADELIGRPVLIEVQLARGESAQFHEKIQFVSPEISGGGTFEVSIQFDNQKTKEGKWLIRPGASAFVWLRDAKQQPRKKQVESTEIDLRLPVSESASTSIESKMRQATTKSLEELLASANETYKRTSASFESGTADLAEYALAKRHYEHTAARLDATLGKFDNAIKHYKAAIAASKSLAEAMQLQFDAGTVSLSDVIKAQRLRLDAQIELLELQQKVRPAEDSPEVQRR